MILPQRETRFCEAIIMSDMRALIVYAVLLLLLAISVGVGLVASDWPRWCRMAQWCVVNWPPGR